MWLLRELGIALLLLATCQCNTQQYKKKTTVGLKRTVETYSHPAPTETFGDNQGNGKGKVIVKTIKSISPSEYLTTGYLGSTVEVSTAKGKVPLGTVSYNAFEPESTKKPSTANFVSTETVAPGKNKPNYKHYTGSTGIGGLQKSSSSLSSTLSPAPVRTTSVEPGTTLPPNFQFSFHSAEEIPATDKSLKIISTRGKNGNGRYTIQKIVKKPTKIEPKVSDSKPEETGFNGYHYDVGSLSFESKHTAPQGGGMMGASYMRSSSPFYNYHVMLD